MKKHFLLLILLTLTAGLFADVKLPKLISNGMILQRGHQVTLWGWADIGEEVSVSFKNEVYRAVAGSDQKWSLKIPAQKAGGPYTISIKGSNQIEITNVLFGDVWLCSGQSNMELPMERVRVKFEDAVIQSANPNIRQFDVPRQFSFNTQMQDYTAGTWVEASPVNVLKFSAAAYFFAKDLYDRYKVPIGLIKSAVGGSPAEAWISESGLKKFPQYLAVTHRFRDSLLVDSIRKRDEAISTAWNTQIDQNDAGLKGPLKWFDVRYDALDWKNISLPGYWDDQIRKDFPSELRSHDVRSVNGSVWFRKEIDVPAAMLNKPALLVLGTIVDRDEVYVNGVFVGSTGYQYPPRRYQIPSNLLRPGKNSIVVRVVSNSGRGGFVEDKEYSLKSGALEIDLKGIWQYKLAYASTPMPGGATTFHYQPAGLFNGMIAPLERYMFKGVIWYQGESNTARPAEYQELFSTLIKDWRIQLAQPKLPFIYAQLASFMKDGDQPSESNWAELREAQLKTLRLPKTAMAVLIDAGEWNDIHPLDKQTVGKRLALGAMKEAYNEMQVVASGPVFKSMKRRGNRLVIKFKEQGSGLVSRGGGQLKHFAIASADGKFVWAKAEIRNNRVEVWSEDVRQPTAVRYGWANNPESAGLYNEEGLPASPFRAEL